MFSARRLGRSCFFQNAAMLLCILYGAALLLNIQAFADGGWILYAKALTQGTKLYADQHLALQPLFVLQTKLALKMLGDGWLLLKLPAFLEMLAYLGGIRWLASRLPMSDWEKGLLIACSFCLTTLFDAFRFDDYHVLTDCFVIYSLVLLVDLRSDSVSYKKSLGTVLFLGILSGLAITNRVNDGGVLFLTTGLALLFLIPRGKLISVGIFTTATALTARFVVFLTGDTLRDYSFYSVFHAAGSKGGFFRVFRAPLLFPLNILKALATAPAYRSALLLDILLLLLVILLAFKARDAKGAISRSWVVSILLGIAVISSFAFGRNKSINLAVALGGFWMLVILLLSVIVVARAVGHLTLGAAFRNWNMLELLLLIPVGQLLSASMSSAGFFVGLYTPVAFSMVLLPVASPIPIGPFFQDGYFQQTVSRWFRGFLLGSCVIFLVSTVAFKVRVPLSWHTYIEPPMFTERVWYRHPLYGPMYIRGRQLSLITRVCAFVEGGKIPELLSLPYPYPNYFCGISPWNGYVQTFFDTVSADTIHHLMAQLDSSPPKWILYQRQMGILSLHELFYNGNQPIAHRFMDRQIMSKIDSGAWKVVMDWNSLVDPRLWNTLENAHWMLIETR